MAIASALGVDLKKPSELTHYGSGKDGRHITGGFYHLIGRILDGADLLRGPPDFKTFEFERLTPKFEFGFTSSAALVPSTFTATPVLQLEWQTTIDWCIPDTEPTSCDDSQ
ncbi:MAG: hypothetical protein JNM99_04340 [Verrucomicrobiaceae bacterium]|nr:hypothetical protein [Verrucomicrobiaceae bacterium]